MTDTIQPTQIILTHEKIVDILMHSATREDIAKIDVKMDSKFNDILTEFKRSNEAMESRINEKFEALESRTNEKFEALESRINKKFEAVESRTNERFEVLESRINENFKAVEVRLGEKINTLETRTTTEFSKIEVRYNWIIGLILTVGIALAGLIIKMPH